MSAAAFDAAATSYERGFTDTRLGRVARQRVWWHLRRAFGAGDRLLELGCGPGTDALHLVQRGARVLATDASEAMLRLAKERSVATGADDLLALARLDLAGIGQPGWSRPLVEAGWDGRPFDGAWSDFGALNCLPRLDALAAGLAGVIRPAGRLVLVLMGPICPWEVAWHVLHAEPRRAVRRWRAGRHAALPGGGRVRVWYPSPVVLEQQMRPWFRAVSVEGIGVALPPTGLAEALEARPRLLAVLAGLDRRLGRHPGLARLADHYLVELERA